MTRLRWTAIALVLLMSCNSKDMVIAIKNECFEKQLADLKTRTIYDRVLTSFYDTLKIVQSTSKSLLEEQADDAIFLTKDSLKCLTLVLERNKGKTGSFGSARVWQGQLMDGRWKWEESMSFSFDHDFFDKYEDNTFDNISNLARYSVLTNGDVRVSGCDLDEYYWFVYLND